ncbi:MAG: anaerobic ribonucleoside-triphosphate reductase activating protein [Paludibacteraceae bacterium]|nr:anaerobic ribonucleoside-triphosphate reductase activating protein [Paludibacteraceae bacterium]
MLKYADYDIVFQEIPDEVTLAINISNCPNHCVGCHSPYLMQDVGEVLDEAAMDSLLEKYGRSITCVCFMGGDADPFGVAALAKYLKNRNSRKIKVGWYSGKNQLPESFPLVDFDYVKIGRYMAEFGPLKSTTTNQRLYRVEGGEMVDITDRFWKK